ncbi:chemotaxis protein CheW [Psychrobacter lutiphocae]|uniref:chemotaxis protein CheW n=1 Tax=Psychrobacter lutiphocae TaxID=540500 RepID=UPI000374A8ED|nr:chemotaxis protein CheW [Psychrobacter lutiphocae]
MALKGFIELLRLEQMAQLRKQVTQKETPQWQGVAFTLAGEQLVAPIGEVTEVVATPQAVTTVPLAKPWLLGVANVRGQLLPLVDLAKFLNLQRQHSKQKTYSLTQAQMRQRKVLIVKQHDILVGLLVDAVAHIKKFSPEQYVAKSLPSSSPFLPYNHGQFIEEKQHWPVFMPSLLLADPRFLEAALLNARSN